MRIHVLGICGTFMGGLAALAREAGHDVSGSDSGVYPPMSDMLAELGIVVHDGYDPATLRPAPDCVVIGNALSRGNPCVEHVLDQGMNFMSGPQWLFENVLKDRWVLAVAGTHGKTTTAGLLAWIMDQAGMEPGFLIGGVLSDFRQSARLGTAPYFVIEADEYDTAFFDKRSKFIHYRPRTLVLTNLEFDHADIFDDLDAIKTQFHYLIRTVRADARIIVNALDDDLKDVLDRGCWSPVERYALAQGVAAEWQARTISTGPVTEFEILADEKVAATVRWQHAGEHNIENALAAVVAAAHAGIPVERAATALHSFSGIRRRLELRGEAQDIKVYDDFAHHPTEIASSITALTALADGGSVVAVVEPRSNSMKLGVHRDSLMNAFCGAKRVYLHRSDGLKWNLNEVAATLPQPTRISESIDQLIDMLVIDLEPGDSVLVMSNGGFGGIHDRLLDALATAADASSSGT